MWDRLRPQTRSVWKNPEVLNRLSRYRDIIDKKRYAKYLLAKEVPYEKNLNQPLDDLWSAHEEISKDFWDYLESVDSGEERVDQSPSPSFLDLKSEIANRILQSCHFCERKCGADRTKDELGWCKLASESRVSSAFLHTGEEAPLVPSGTIFFASCCFGCVFCQNYDISTNPNSGDVVGPKKLAGIAEGLVRRGAININYVGGDPIPNTHTIVSSLKHQTANITQLWNSNLYCSLETMKLLSEIFDVWLPDFKYGDDECAKRLSGVTNYFEVVSRNHLMAYNSGEVIIRHLVMPNHIDCCSIPILEWISENMPMCMVNIMGQYRPTHKVHRGCDRFKDIQRSVNNTEMQRVQTKADELDIVWKPVS